MRELIIPHIKCIGGIEIVGTGKNCVNTLAEIKQLYPDVILINFVSILIDDHILMHEIFLQNPTPVMVVGAPSYIKFKSTSPIANIDKPTSISKQELEQFSHQLVNEIQKLYANKFDEALLPYSTNTNVTLPKQNSPKLRAFSSKKQTDQQHIIALAASTGGTNATVQVIKDLPNDFPAILIVQHMPPGFTAQYAQRLNQLCQMHVVEASDGDRIYNGYIYIAPGNLHLRLDKDADGYYIHIDKSQKITGHRPSADALFQSVADYAPTNSTGIILTGMGQDGAKGLLEMHTKGAFTIGQDEETSVIYGMPRVAYEIGAVSQQASIEKIADILQAHIQSLSN